MRICPAAVLAVLCVVALACPVQARIKVHPESQQFVDEHGRVRFFHGVNVVYKLPPFHPELHTFDPVTSLCDEDLDLLADEWGLNMVRLGVMWSAVDVGSEPGTYNTTYLDIMSDLVTRMGEKGIYTLVDAHQDLLSPRLCGEGMPDFAVQPAPSKHDFPWPLPFSLPRDPRTGRPDMKACNEHPFAEFNLSEAVGTAWEALYKSETIQQWFANHWAAVARAFAGNDAVLGYELLNEPWPGYLDAHPGNVLRRGYVDKHWLAPMYARLHESIRAVDDETLVFYEPCVMEDFVWQTTGFESGPGGSAYDDRQVFSYHIYCDIDMNKTGDPNSPWLCDKLDDSYWGVAARDIARVGGGSFLTEFGALGGNEKSELVIDAMLDKAEEMGQSWAWWALKSYHDPTTQNQVSESFYDAHGHLQVRKVAALARTYAQAVAGRAESVRSKFDRPSGAFRLSFASSATSTGPTEIFLAEKIHYPRGFSVDVTPSGVQWKHVRANRIEVDSSMLADGTNVTVRITAK